MSQTLQSVLCITTNKYLVRVLVVLLHACFSVVGPIPFLLAAIFFPVHPYIGSTTVLPDTSLPCRNGCGTELRSPLMQRNFGIQLLERCHNVRGSPEMRWIDTLLSLDIATKIARDCLLFLRQGSTIHCVVTRARRYFIDPPFQSISQMRCMHYTLLL